MPDIIIENRRFRLVVGEDCIARSLIHKASGQECLDLTEPMALFAVTQPRPFNNEIKLAHPNKRTTYQGNHLVREGDKLIVGFETIPYHAEITLTNTDEYIGFRLSDFIIRPTDYGYLSMTPPPVEAFRLLQLPVKHRKYFGEWLNVSWDDAVAVNVLATSPYASIDAEKRRNHRVMYAEALREVKLRGTEAALIVTDSDALLDAIDRLEKDYDLPRGVESRRDPRMKVSYYRAVYLSPENVDKHIAYCKKSGYGMMTVYSLDVFTGPSYRKLGDYDEYKPGYPEGFESLRKMVQKIKDAGIIPGFHFLHTHIGIHSRYVTPRASHRLHLTKHFTLAKPLGETDNTVFVEENPENTVMAENCRVLRFGGELITYEGYSTEYPYCFTGCQRGHLNTQVEAHPEGLIGGILDISEFGAISIYIDQNSSLQDEIAQKLAFIYSAGFEYAYFDGAEGTNEPYGFHVANAQYRVWKRLQPTPIFCEAAAKSHFSWHMISGGNAFDQFRPAVFKEMIRLHPFAEAPRMRQDLTRLNFGWWGLYVNQTQPDHWEYGSSLAAAWDCPATFNAYVPDMEENARTDDLLEVLRRWEDVRVHGLLTEAQRRDIQEKPEQERILLINEAGEYELLPYWQLETGDEKLRAFRFCRQGKQWVVYWHTCGEGTLKLELPEIEVREELALAPISLFRENELPLGRRRYLCTGASQGEVEAAFRSASIE